MMNEPPADAAVLKAREDKESSPTPPSASSSSRGTAMLVAFLAIFCLAALLTFYNLPERQSGSGAPATPVPQQP